VAKSAKYLLIGSTKSYSGKSATILGVAHQLQEKGLDVAYGKPLGTCLSADQPDGMEEDVRFMTEILNLPEKRVRPPSAVSGRRDYSKTLTGR
jgi:BioD-like phosphotransacetylase family protein